MPLQEHEIPTIIVVGPLNSWEADIASNTIYNTTDSGTTSIFMDHSRYNADFSEEEDIDTEISTADTSSSYTSIMGVLGTNYLLSDWISIPSTTFFTRQSPFIYSIDTEWYLSPQVRSVFTDTYMDFRINLGVIPTRNDVDVDIFLSNVRYYRCVADLYCCFMGIPKTIEIAIAQGNGRITGVYTDIYTTAVGSPYLNTSIYSAMEGVSETLQAELTSISGAITSMPSDVYSTALGISTPTSVEFKTRSLFTGDFFVERDSFVTASSTAWVDLVDYLYPIDTNNTFFYVEGVLASGIYFEDIPNGKRMYYNPLDDFYSDGVLNYSIHAENSIGEVEEKDFYFLYGYDLQLNEVANWGPNDQILVRAEANNLAFCPSLAGAAFDFTTVDLASFNLGCTITPVDFVDLGFKISPQSTVFFYGKTYTVKLQNVKDFAGNIMPDLEYTFTIEDPTV